MLSHKITLTGNSIAPFEVCSSTGFLLEMFSLLQQEESNLYNTILRAGYSLVLCDRPKGEPQAVLEFCGERLECLEEGDCYYHSATTECYEFMVAPGG